MNKHLENASIEIYNVLGEKIYSGKIQGENTPIDISSLANGIYQVKVVNGKSVVCQTKIVKQN